MESSNLEYKKSILVSHFKSLGFQVQDGIKYGIDFLLYTDNPENVHSKYGVLVENGQSFFDLMSVQRVCNTVKKELIVVVFRNSTIFDIFSVERFLTTQ
ncbi:tRNA-intron endonuclease [Vairimorpha necatrix]|uniref:tRNA-intron lyase n=1 Tax=Vairimorpha necatrix TaxID=6039 RepID=A0AAX4J7U1_9MICR